MNPQLESNSSATDEYTLSSLQQYAKEAAAAADVISNYCSMQGLPQPSFDASAPSINIPDTAPVAVHDARQSLIASAVRLQQLATEPAEYLPNIQIHVSVNLET